MLLEQPHLIDTAPSGGADAPGEARRLRQELRQAAQGGGFTLLYQPRRELRTQAIVGAAAQLRWPRRRGGMTAASGFMPLLEAYGLSAGVAAWTLATACRAATTWTSGQISVQVEPCALNDGSLLGLVGQALADSGLDAERLELEFAEPALAACTAETLFTLASLRDLGVCVALEAFGSESANLLPLKHLPVTALKLDRSLVRDLPEDRDAGAIIRAATDFAHALGVTVVACGLESPAQLAALRAAGCDEGQGSLCGRAVAEGDW